MTVSYTKEQRARARVDGTVLITVDVPGCRFHGPVSAEEAAGLLAWLNGMFDRRYGKEPSVATSGEEATREG